MGVVLIRLDSSGAGVRVQVGPPDLRPHEGLLPVGALEACAAEIAGLLRPTAGVAVPGRDAARSRAEEAAGRALGALLAAAPGVRERLRGLLGELRGGGEAAVLVVDCPEQAARALPWELLALDDAPLEALGELVVARLVSGPRPRPVRWIGKPRLSVWSPDPDDPLCARRVQALGDLTRARGLSPPISPDEDITLLPEMQTLLHVVCHGVADASGGRLLVGDDEQGAGTVGHTLAAPVRQARVVVLEVCEAGAADGPELDNLACRLVAAGARACVSARGRLSIEAIAAFDEGFLDALLAGASLVAAVAAGRRAVRALASPRPDARWHLLSLFVSSLGELEQGVEAPPAIPGWPAASPAAARWLAEAWRLAEEARRGFFGFEHLLLALPVADAGALALARHAVEPRREALLSGISALQRRGPLNETITTRRLAALRGRLSSGFDAPDLWQALAADPGPGIVLDLGLLSGAETFRGATLEASAGLDAPPATALEVVGGPEDGRLLCPVEGEAIGRAEVGGPGLYPVPGPVDPYLSRTHLRWLGAGRALLGRGATLRRPGHPDVPVTGELTLYAGDLLILSPVTRLLARVGA